MATQTKDELVEELSSQLTKNELVELLGSKLKKDELASVLDADDDDDATKEQLVRRLASRTKDALVQAVAGKLTKDEVQKAIESHSRRQEKDDDRDEHDERDDDRQRTERAQRSERTQRDERGERRRPKPESDDELDWSAELDWSPPPRPTPAPVAFVGAAPFMPSQRVRVDLSGLPMLGVFAGKGTSAAGTIVGVNARARMVRVYLDAVFDGAKEIVVPPERVIADA